MTPSEALLQAKREARKRMAELRAAIDKGDWDLAMTVAGALSERCGDVASLLLEGADA